MPHLSINNKWIVTSLNNNMKLAAYLLLLIIYYGWMDIGLFVHLQHWNPNFMYDNSKVVLNRQNKTLLANNQNNLKETRNDFETFSVYKPLSVKLIMVDHTTHYVHDIFARYIEDTLHFTTIFPWVTPNVVSYTGLLFALIASRLILSDKVLYCQIAAILFELRNLADSLDGVVYRSHLRQSKAKMYEEALKNTNNMQVVTAQPVVYQSGYGSSGYNVDYFCDGFAGLFFVFAILFKFLKHPPLKNQRLNIILIRSDESKNSLKEKKNLKHHDSYDLLEMSQFLNEHDPTDINNNSLSNKDNHSSNEQMRYADRFYTSRQVLVIVFFFGMRLLFTGLFWDRFVHNYHDLLMKLSPDANKRNMQISAFKSIGMWLIMWFWRLGNACAILEHLALATFFNKLWDYVYYTSIIGWIYLLVLSFFTQVHYLQLYNMIEGVL